MDSQYACTSDQSDNTIASDTANIGAGGEQEILLFHFLPLQDQTCCLWKGFNPALIHEKKNAETKITIYIADSWQVLCLLIIPAKFCPPPFKFSFSSVTDPCSPGSVRVWSHNHDTQYLRARRHYADKLV